MATQSINKPYDYSLFIRITNSCNFQCKHCCYSCGPGGKTMTESEIEQILEKNIEHNLSSIMFSGGEVFTAKKTLIHGLDYIKKNKKHMPLSTVTMVSTNGTWAKDKNSFYKIVEGLRYYGVDEIDIASNDEYHKEQGLDIQNLEDLIKSVPSGNPSVCFRRGSGRAVPFGRAKNLPKDNHRDPYCSIIPEPSRARITIDPYGNAYPCCWEVTKPIGSTFEKSVKEIFEQAKHDPLISILIKEGPGGVGNHLGTVKPEDYNSYSCILCEKVFRNLKT